MQLRDCDDMLNGCIICATATTYSELWRKLLYLCDVIFPYIQLQLVVVMVLSPQAICRVCFDSYWESVDNPVVRNLCIVFTAPIWGILTASAFCKVVLTVFSVCVPFVFFVPFRGSVLGGVGMGTPTTSSWPSPTLCLLVCCSSQWVLMLGDLVQKMSWRFYPVKFCLEVILDCNAKCKYFFLMCVISNRKLLNICT